jgi:tetrahydromethanopterin S-methyltransferase subunit G
MDEARLDDLVERVSKLENHMDKINCELGQLVGQSRTVELLLKYVVTPLLLIVGTLAGVTLV